MSGPVRVVIADDHQLVAEALTRLFEDTGGFRVVARCRNGQEALDAAVSLSPDILLLDLRMPLLDGKSVLRELAERKSSTRVVLLTAAITEDDLIEVLRLGAAGVVMKDSDWALLIDCVRRVHAGEQWIDQRCAQRALERVLRRQAGTEEASRLFTHREIEIIRLVATGLRNQEIAEKLSITEGTVKIHLHNVYEKLDVSGRHELTRYAREKGLA